MNAVKNGVDLNQGIQALVDGGQIVNLTPHPLNIILDDGTTVTVAPSGVVPRVASDNVVVAPGFVTTTLGDVDGLPDLQPGVLLVVSALTGAALPGRDDLIGPDTSPQGAVRDQDGRIIGVRGFQF